MPVIDRPVGFVMGRRALSRSRHTRATSFLARPRRAYKRGRAPAAAGVASTNVMTTNTTLLAINAAEILRGTESTKFSTGGLNPNYAQARNEFAALLPLGLGFFVGTALGAIAYINFGLPCVLLAIFPVGSLALWYMRPLLEIADPR